MAEETDIEPTIAPARCAAPAGSEWLPQPTGAGQWWHWNNVDLKPYLKAIYHRNVGQKGLCIRCYLVDDYDDFLCSEYPGVWFGPVLPPPLPIQNV